VTIGSRGECPLCMYVPAIEAVCWTWPSVEQQTSRNVCAGNWAFSLLTRSRRSFSSAFAELYYEKVLGKIRFANGCYRFKSWGLHLSDSCQVGKALRSCRRHPRVVSPPVWGSECFWITLVEGSKTRKQGGYRLRMLKGMCWWHYIITAQNLTIPRVSAIGWS
jgi:hypothetical protein